MTKLLLDRESVNPDSLNKNGMPPLSYAAEEGHDDVVKLLLERGAFNPSASPDNSQASPPVCHSNPDELSVNLVSQQENPSSDPTSDQSQPTPDLPASPPEQKVVPNPESPEQDVPPNPTYETPDVQYKQFLPPAPTNLLRISPAHPCLPPPLPSGFFHPGFLFFLLPSFFSLG
ncbi:hypothetical protein L873DRAFT_1885891 [Choiromyces venosus 120613-1]|uniref:Uncharacterized protein n=1 Tax=Choiromyces venosus 120613-1 TaxID=1336337 RepID=A0A3N4IUV3_9PEZI|nr:hypothetical protein L873DRAFT_1885891 [Choiromyces venosus 120613-1]